MKWIAYFIFLISTFALSSCWDSTKIETLDENDLEGLLPSFYLNHVGFDLPADFPFAVDGIDNGLQPLPMFPMFKRQMFSRKFLGVTIPGKYLGNSSGCHSNSSSLFLDTIGTSSKQNPLAAQAMEQLRKLKDEDGNGYQVFYFNCDLYAIRKDISVVFQNSTTIGLSLTLGLFNDTISLGDRFELGANFDIGGLVTYQNKRGLNLASSFNDIFQGIDLLARGDNAEKLIEKTIQFTPYTRYYLQANAKNISNVFDFFNRPKAKYNHSVVLPEGQSPKLASSVERDSFSEEVQDSLNDFSDSDILNKEVDWTKKLSRNVEGTLVVDQPDDNRFIQNICDYLAQAYQVPREIWPRCRIAATWEPNAWAYPGGDVFITAGLLGIIGDLDSIQLVLGHEIGHVIARHTTKTMPYSNALTYTASAAAIALNVGLTGFTFGAGWGLAVPVTWLNWWPLANGMAMVGGPAAGYAFDLLFMGPVAGLMAYSRAHEWQADRFGHQVALATGADNAFVYNGWGQFIEYVKKYFNPPETVFAELMADHPNGKERQVAIERRYHGYHLKLAPYETQNRLDPSVYDEYQKLHAKFHLGSEAFGQWVLGERMKNESRAQTYAWKSFLSPAGKCITYALGGSLPE